MKKLIIFILTIVAMVGCCKESPTFTKQDILGTWDAVVTENIQTNNIVIEIVEFVDSNGVTGISFNYKEMFVFGMDDVVDFYSDPVRYKLGIFYGDSTSGDLLFYTDGRREIYLGNNITITLTNKH